MPKRNLTAEPTAIVGPGVSGPSIEADGGNVNIKIGASSCAGSYIVHILVLTAGLLAQPRLVLHTRYHHRQVCGSSNETERGLPHFFESHSSDFPDGRIGVSSWEVIQCISIRNSQGKSVVVARLQVCFNVFSACDWPPRRRAKGGAHPSGKSAGGPGGDLAGVAGVGCGGPISVA